jgi:diacylglycerol kinase family enzyme
VVAGGGDGTIRAVASVLVDGEVPLGVLPLGTLNHFAGDLKIPTDLEAAAHLIAEGEVHRLDVGEVNGEIFLNNSSLGFYPPIVQARDQEMRRSKHGKWLSMAIATFKLLPKLRSLHVRISSGDWQAERKTEVLFVGNNEYNLSAFGHGAPDRVEDSGSLYLYLARSRSRLGLIGLALAGLVRDIKRTESVEEWRFPEFKVEVRKKHAIPVAFDGEVSVMRPPLKYRTRPRALPVILPPPEPQAPR